MSLAELTYCECGTPLLRKIGYHIPPSFWKRYLGSFLEPDMPLVEEDPFQPEPFYRFYRWRVEALFLRGTREEGWYAVDTEDIIEHCPACGELLNGAIKTGT